MRLFDDLSRAILKALSQPKPDQNTPAEDEPSKPNPGATKRPFRPYYDGSGGETPPSKPASRPPSPPASRQPSRPSSARSASIARKPPRPASQEPSAVPTSSARTSSAPSTTSRLPSAVATSSAQSPRSRSSTTKTKSVEEIIAEFVYQTNKKLKQYEFEWRVGSIKEELDDIKRTAHFIKIYDNQKKNTPKYLEQNVSFTDNKGFQYNYSTIGQHRLYLYDKTKFYKELYGMLEKHGHSNLNPDNPTQNSKKGGGRGL